MKLDKRILPNIERTKKFCFKNKTPELWQARRDLELYYKENMLDPTKNWTRDPVHGEKVLKLIRRLNFELDKISSKYPLTDSRKMKKLKEKAETIAKGKVAKEKKEKETEKVNKRKGRAATKYDYPLIDGREMTSVEKKKYRQEQRNKASGKVKPEKKEKTKKVKKETTEKVKKTEKVKPTKKEALKKVKKVKSSKEED